MTAVLVLGLSLNMHAEDYLNMGELRLTTPVMEPRLTYEGTSNFRPELELRQEDHTPWAKENWTWMRTNPEVKPYKVMDDLSFVGIPIFAAGWIIKGEKASFRQDYKNPHSNTRLITNFKTGIDDYTQFFGPAMTVGLKLGGYEGRSDWGRLLGSSLKPFCSLTSTALIFPTESSTRQRKPSTSPATWSGISLHPTPPGT